MLSSEFDCTRSSCTFPIASLTFFFYATRAHPDLHSFPTRRSSDLLRSRWGTDQLAGIGLGIPGFILLKEGVIRNSNNLARSEEHTSELQSRENLVCRLLLEKKKNLNGVACTDTACFGSPWPAISIS